MTKRDRPEIPEGELFIHCIDTAGLIVSVNEPWLRFARDNGAPELTLEAVLGRPLWDFIVDAETKQLYGALIDRVLRSDLILQVPYRCDSPEARREFRMAVSRTLTGLIEFRNRVEKITPRSPIALLEAASERSEETITMCSWCKKIALPDKGYVELEEAIAERDLFGTPPLPALRHVACPACTAAVRRILFGSDA
jgi:hypothetical protein